MLVAARAFPVQLCMSRGAKRSHTEDDRVPAEFEEIARPHVESFDWFLSEGIHNVVSLLEPLVVSHSPVQYRSAGAAGCCRLLQQAYAVICK